LFIFPGKLAESAAAAAPAASSVMYLCRLVVVAKMHRAARRGAAWRESRELDTCCCVLTDTGRPRPLSNVYFSVVDDRRTPAAAAAAAELLPVSCLRGGGRQRRSPGCRPSAATGARGTLGFHRINPAQFVTTHACRQNAARTTAVFLLPLSA